MIAWFVVVSQIVTAVLLLLDKCTRLASIVNIIILTTGIVTVHFREGRFVVGGGRNGMEYSVVLILVLIAILFPNGWNRNHLS